MELVIFIVNYFFISYIVYRYINLFYKEKNTNSKIETISYIIYSIISIIIGLFVPNQAVTILLHLILILILTKNYKGSLKRSVFIAISINFIYLVIEIILNIFAHYFKLRFLLEADSGSVLTFSMVTILSYIVVLIIETYESDKTILKEQNDYYEEQLKLMGESLKSNRTIVHDLKNHITCLYILVENDRKEKTLDYLSRMTKVLNKKEGISNTGNHLIDSIINLKLQESEKEGITVSIDMDITKEINIPFFDITVVLGNLLDNALEAVRKIEKDKYINVRLEYREDKLILEMENSFNGIVIREDNIIRTSNLDKENHGIGLKNVESVVKKYNGFMEIEYDESNFMVKVCMETPKEKLNLQNQGT